MNGKDCRSAYVFHETKEEHRETTQVGRELESTTAHVAATKLLLVGLQELNNLGLYGISGGIET